MIRETIIFVGVGIVLAFAWHHFWIQPHDEFIYAVIDCMSENNYNDQAGYNICAEQVRNNLNNLR